MIMRSIASKIGNPEDYVGKPFLNENRETVGTIIECNEKGCNYELIIDAELDLYIEVPNISFSVGLGVDHDGDHYDFKTIL